MIFSIKQSNATLVVPWFLASTSYITNCDNDLKWLYMTWLTYFRDTCLNQVPPIWKSKTSILPIFYHIGLALAALVHRQCKSCLFGSFLVEEIFSCWVPSMSNVYYVFAFQLPILTYRDFGSAHCFWSH